MKSVPNQRVAWAGAALLASCLLPAGLLGQDQASLTNALDSLLNIEVSTAAKFAQTSREAPASVTVITSQEIRRQGFRTLADVLESVPGFYVTNNHNYASLGVRGFGPLGGDNKRVLFLMDGHTLNENFLDGIRIGTGFGLDLGFIDRVEVVRGPGSALYGSNAMLAVVNIVTRAGGSVDGIEGSAEVGSYGLRRGSVVLGREFRSGLEIMASGTWSDAVGTDVYFPEWDDPLTNQGVASDLDWDESLGLVTSVKYGDLRFLGLATDRQRGDPSASFGSTFNDPASRSADRRLFAELAYERDLSPNKSLLVRSFYDGAEFDVTYPYAQGGNQTGGTRGQWFGVEGRFRWDPTPAHRMTFGAEYRNNVKAETIGSDPVFRSPGGNFPSTVASVFLQSELQLLENLALTLGGRADHYSTVGTAMSPRGGLVYHAGGGTTLKALYGEAFRAPNQPELNIEVLPFIKRNPDIEPERIRTVELVVEQRLTEGFHATVAAYDYRMSKIIGGMQDPADGVLTFVNFGQVDARGMEFGIRAEPAEGYSLRAGYILQQGTGGQAVPEMANAPAHGLRVAASAVLAGGFTLATNLVYDHARAALPARADGTDHLWVTDVALTGAIFERLHLSLIAENVFDTEYRHPAPVNVRQGSVPQYGRVFRIRVDAR